MADQEHHHQTHHHGEGGAEEGKVEAKDRGLFDFMGKKEGQKPHEESKIATDFDQKVKIEESEEKKHGSLLEKLHRSDSSSSSSSEEEVEGEGGEKIKKKKKKGLKEKIKEKVEGDHQKGEEKAEHHDTTVPVEKEEAAPHAAETDEKKGFLDKIKDKLPGHKKPEDQAAVPESTPAPEHHGSAPAAEHHGHEGEAKEKKGILEKIKEKLPGYHPKSGEEEEKKETSAESH